MRRLAGAAVAAILVMGGCGDDEEESADTATSPPAQTEPATTTEETPTTDAVTVPEEEVEPELPPEEQPGGAGDEEPAQSQAAFTGRGGRLRPAVVRVAPFIAIRVELRSADGVEYGLSCGGRRVLVDAEVETASVRIAGRRPGEKIRYKPLGAHNGVTISASAEPGP